MVLIHYWPQLVLKIGPSSICNYEKSYNWNTQVVVMQTTSNESTLKRHKQEDQRDYAMAG